MSNLTPPSQVFLFGSFLYRKDLVSKSDLVATWENRFGDSLTFHSDLCPMKNYYSPEMGEISNLDRFFILSDKTRAREILLEGKLWSDALEKEQFTDGGNRSVNLDIGVLSLENLQLATGKNFTHRVYIGNNIYSDLTLIFQKGGFKPLPWSYPDYSSPNVLDFFNWARKLLHLAIE